MWNSNSENVFRTWYWGYGRKILNEGRNIRDLNNSEIWVNFIYENWKRCLLFLRLLSRLKSIIASLSKNFTGKLTCRIRLMKILFTTKRYIHRHTQPHIQATNLPLQIIPHLHSHPTPTTTVWDSPTWSARVVRYPGNERTLRVT
jgi:hypothetical protein